MTLYEVQQISPRVARLQEAQSQRALDAAAAHLIRSAQHLVVPTPDYREALRHSIQAIRQAYIAFLVWHSLPPRPQASLAELGGPAEQLASMLRTCRRRALPLEPLEAAFESGTALTAAVREEVETSYYTARNTLAVVLGELPERITLEAIKGLNRAQATRSGLFTPAPSEPRPAVQTAPGRPAYSDAEGLARPRSLVTA